MYSSMKEIADRAEQTGTPFWEVIQTEDCTEEAISPEESWKKMKYQKNFILSKESIIV